MTDKKQRALAQRYPLMYTMPVGSSFTEAIGDADGYAVEQLAMSLRNAAQHVRRYYGRRIRVTKSHDCIEKTWTFTITRTE